MCPSACYPISASPLSVRRTSSPTTVMLCSRPTIRLVWPGIAPPVPRNAAGIDVTLVNELPEQLVGCVRRQADLVTHARHLGVGVHPVPCAPALVYRPEHRSALLVGKLCWHHAPFPLIPLPTVRLPERTATRPCRMPQLRGGRHSPFCFLHHLSRTAAALQSALVGAFSYVPEPRLYRPWSPDHPLVAPKGAGSSPVGHPPGRARGDGHRNLKPWAWGVTPRHS